MALPSRRCGRSFLLTARHLVLYLVVLFGFACAAPDEQREYLVVGVSGGLQDGFPDHNKLDYHSGQPDESRAIFVGRALVRGYKAFLDVMQEGWRQYTPEPGQPLINSNVFASGCYEHANEYWIYLIDSRQVMSVLNNEPRFLSITPDTGLLDLTADETHPAVRDFMLREIHTQSKQDEQHVAVPLVTAVWFQYDSHVPSPPIRVHADGTEVTNFPESLALWAAVDDSDRTAMIRAKCINDDPFLLNEKACTPEVRARAQEAEQRFWDGIRRAVRAAEQNRPLPKKRKKVGPPFQCKKKTRFGVSNDTARVNYPFSVREVTTALKEIGYEVDYLAGEMHPVSQDSTNTEL